MLLGVPLPPWGVLPGQSRLKRSSPGRAGSEGRPAVVGMVVTRGGQGALPMACPFGKRDVPAVKVLCIGASGASGAVATAPRGPTPMAWFRSGGGRGPARCSFRRAPAGGAWAAIGGVARVPRGVGEAPAGLGGGRAAPLASVALGPRALGSCWVVRGPVVPVPGVGVDPDGAGPLRGWFRHGRRGRPRGAGPAWATRRKGDPTRFRWGPGWAARWQRVGAGPCPGPSGRWGGVQVGGGPLRSRGEPSSGPRIRSGGG